MIATLSPSIWAALVLAAFITTKISAITGMAGGVLLFSFMSLFMSLETLIPIHGLVQLGSNSSRLYFLREHALGKIVSSFAIGALFGAGGATWLKSIVDIPSEYPISFVVILIIYVLFKPKRLPELAIPFWSYSFVGVVAGFLGIFIGTVGPFISVFFVRSDLSKEQIVSTKSFIQGFIHLIKVPAFMFLGYDYLGILPLSVSMIVAAIFGAKVGVMILRKIDQKVFVMLFKICLFSGACRLAYKVIVG